MWVVFFLLRSQKPKNQKVNDVEGRHQQFQFLYVVDNQLLEIILQIVVTKLQKIVTFYQLTKQLSLYFRGKIV